MLEPKKPGEKRSLFDMMEPDNRVGPVYNTNRKKPCPCHAEKRRWYKYGVTDHRLSYREGWKFDKGGECPCKDSEEPFAKDYVEKGPSQRFGPVKQCMSFFDGKKARDWNRYDPKEIGVLMKDCWYWMELSLDRSEYFHGMEDLHKIVKEQAIDVKERKHRTTLVRVFAKVMCTTINLRGDPEGSRVVLLTGRYLDIVIDLPECAIRRAWLCHHVRPDWCKEFEPKQYEAPKQKFGGF